MAKNILRQRNFWIMLVISIAIIVIVVGFATDWTFSFKKYHAGGVVGSGIAPQPTPHPTPTPINVLRSQMGVGSQGYVACVKYDSGGNIVHTRVATGCGECGRGEGCIG